MNRRLYAVVSERGPNWEDGKSMEEHPDWRAHADFMNALVTEGFILLGGPLVGTPEVLLIVRAQCEQEVRDRLSADVWVAGGLLRQRLIAPWWVRLSAFDAT
jgi:uncharacterized protein YciI